MMDEKRANEILKNEVKADDGGLYSLGWYLNWEIDDNEAILDGRFTADELEAIAWWMKNNYVRNPK